MKKLIDANVRLLTEINELLQRLDSATYTRTSPLFLNTSIGGHVRHCLEHYQCFLRSIKYYKVNYDDRARDIRIETLPEVAIAESLELQKKLLPLESVHYGSLLNVYMSYGPDEDSASWQHSSTGRELQFLVSHTVHHCALIASLCKCFDVPLSPEFGVAHSTIRFRNQSYN